MGPPLVHVLDRSGVIRLRVGPHLLVEGDTKRSGLVENDLIEKPVNLHDGDRCVIDHMIRDEVERHAPNSGEDLARLHGQPLRHRASVRPPGGVDPVCIHVVHLYGEVDHLLDEPDIIYVVEGRVRAAPPSVPGPILLHLPFHPLSRHTVRIDHDRSILVCDVIERGEVSVDRGIGGVPVHVDDQWDGHLGIEVLRDVGLPASCEVVMIGACEDAIFGIRDRGVPRNVPAFDLTRRIFVPEASRQCVACEDSEDQTCHRPAHNRPAATQASNPPRISTPAPILLLHHIPVRGCYQ